jgi:hypothetical protein
VRQREVTGTCITPLGCLGAVQETKVLGETQTGTETETEKEIETDRDSV